MILTTKQFAPGKWYEFKFRILLGNKKDGIKISSLIEPFVGKLADIKTRELTQEEVSQIGKPNK